MTSSWRLMKVEDIAARESHSIAIGPFGSRMKADQYVPSGIPVVRGKNITNSRTPTGDFVFVTAETAESMPSCILTKGDVVFPHRGAIGEVGYIDGATYPRMMLSTSLMKLTPDPEVADSMFVYYYFRSEIGRRELLMRSSTVGTPGIGQPLSSLRSIPIPVPPVAEQRGIAAMLGALDDKIDSNRRKIALMEELAQAQFVRLFDIDLVEDGVAISGIVNVNPTRSLPKGQQATYVGMASLAEFSAEIYDWEEKAAGSGQRFVNGDVLMARITPCLENGKTAVVDMLAPSEVGWGSTEYVVLAPRAECKTPWIYCLARSESVRAFAISSMSGTSGRQRFQADRFDQYKIAPPSEVALQEFNALAEPMFKLMTSLRDEVLQARALRDALLPELLSGRIRVPESQSAMAGAGA